jgi:hypothetical protein
MKITHINLGIHLKTKNNILQGFTQLKQRSFVEYFEIIKISTLF